MTGDAPSLALALPFLDDLRQVGESYFAEHGYPSPRNEEWRHFDGSALRGRAWESGAGPATSLASRPDLRAVLERVPLAGVPRAHRVDEDLSLIHI